ncbi:TonB-dependent receptor [Hyphomicrobium sp. CS1GBMeth3]|uniref:TonB-dependent receptor domain-containing protein n=1 Tax=Hyphomicrobium sp. CS1GBMeth3 TaxID=1892845 RepID=UPI001FCE0915|nr:TonB-dependent receptor [Hyphomicrobium sp. CS1GBMeth3]
MRSETFTASYSYNPISTDLVNLKVNLYRNNVTMNYDSTPLISNGGGSAGREIDDESMGFDVTNVSKFNLGGVRVSSQYGYEYFFDDVDVINSTTQPGYGVNPSGESSIQGVFSETTFSYGIFDLIGGLRYDRFKVDGQGSVGPGNPLGMPPGPYVVDVDEGRWNPKVTLAATPWQWLQPYVTYAEAFRAPTVSELLTGGVHPATGGPPMFFSPNPFLEPEISKGWEFGANIFVDGLLTRDDRFRFKANYYKQDVENYVTACFSPTGQVFYCNNAGTSDVQGVEIEGNYDAGYVFAGIAYTYTDSDLPPQINGFGAQSYLPDHVLTLTGGLRFLDERLVIGAKGYIVSEAYIGEINVAPGAHPFTDGYELLDLYASYKTDYNTTLGVTVTNVFDRAYTPELSTGASGGFTGDTGRGRTALFTLRSQF